MKTHPCLPPLLALGMALAAPLAQAAEAAAGVRTYVQDGQYAPSGQRSDEDFLSGKKSSLPVLSYSVSSLYGNSRAEAQAYVDGLSGAIRTRLRSEVAAGSYIAGRNAFASSLTTLTGSIDIVGAGPPQVATFGGVFEGQYSFTPVFSDSSIGIDYAFRVGSSPEFNGRLDYERTTGTFSIPFSWTQTVQPGTNIAFDLYLRSTASAQFGVAELDALNTFKITTIDLPPGYSFRADSDGFLSKFGAAVPITPVPEPSTWGLFSAGIAALAWRRRRTRH